MNLEIISESNRLLAYLNRKVQSADLERVKEQFILELKGRYHSLIPIIKDFEIISFQKWMKLIKAPSLDPSNELIICGMDGLKISSEIIKLKSGAFGIICPGKLLTLNSRLGIISEVIRLISKHLSSKEHLHLYDRQKIMFIVTPGTTVKNKRW